MPDEEIKAALADEADRIEEDSEHSTRGHYCASSRWKKLHWVLGGIVAGLAAIAGGSAFADAPTITAVLSTIAAVMVALVTFFNPNDITDRHKSAAGKYHALRNQARRFKQIDMLMSTDLQALRAKVEALADRRDELNAECCLIPYWAYLRGKKGIETGETSYRVDQEKNKCQS